MRHGLLLVTGDVIEITENDVASFTERLVGGGIVEGSLVRRDPRPGASIHASHGVVALKHIVFLIPDLDEWYQGVPEEITEDLTENPPEMNFTEFCKDKARVEKVQEIMGKNIAHITRTDLIEHLGLTETNASKAMLMFELI